MSRTDAPTPLPAPSPMPPRLLPLLRFPRPRVKRPLHVALVIALLAAGSSAAQDGSFQTVDSIRQAAEQALASPDAEVQASLDPALRMPPCAYPLQAQAISAVNVEVQCPQGWRLFVPVRVQRVQSVLVLTQAVAPGQAIPASALAVERRDAGRMAGVPLTELAQAEGQTLRRGGRVGQVITQADLVAAMVLKRGEPVTLVAGNAGFEVRMAGRALADAAQGQVVRVENLSSRRVLQGVVAAPGEVRVGR